MKLTNKKRTLTLNEKEATTMVNAIEILELILNLTENDFTITEPISELEFSSDALLNCFEVLNDLFINYGCDGKNTMKYEMNIIEEE